MADRITFHRRAPGRRGPSLVRVTVRRLARAIVVLVTAAELLVASAAQAQVAPARAEGDTARLPRDIARAVLATWNAPATRRVRGSFTVERQDTIREPLAVLGGPVIVDGVLERELVVINGDATFGPMARVDGNFTIVGGRVNGTAADAVVRGDVRRWRQPLLFRERADSLELDESDGVTHRWARWFDDADRSGRWTDFFVTSAHTYNRVEGLSIYLGPRVRLRRDDVQFDVEALGIVRTGDGFRWTPETRGYRLRGELQLGTDERHVALGARLFDEVDAVEAWTLSDAEVGLASLLFARDYRDYFNRHGGYGYVRFTGSEAMSWTVRVGEERWRPRETLNPFRFASDRMWRPNPAVPNTKVRLLGTTISYDTRNDRRDPRAGWYVTADVEAGDVGAPLTEAPALDDTGGEPYGRFFLDARRYLRVTPHGALNLRLVLGGELFGTLPDARRLSVGGPGALPGYGFRQLYGGDDVGACSGLDDDAYAALGRPARCERMALAQVEWRGDFRVSLFGSRDRTDDERWFVDGLRADGSWVVFANTGRGWLTGDDQGDLAYPGAGLPPLSTFRSDIGVGADLGGLGAYIAWPLDVAGSAPRVFLRLGRRF